MSGSGNMLFPSGMGEDVTVDMFLALNPALPQNLLINHLTTSPTSLTLSFTVLHPSTSTLPSTPPPPIISSPPPLPPIHPTTSALSHTVLELPRYMVDHIGVTYPAHFFENIPSIYLLCVCTFPLTNPPTPCTTPLPPIPSPRPQSPLPRARHLRGR